MTTLYLIRHSQPMKDFKGNYNSYENGQLQNEKDILTPDGEIFALELSKKEELQHIDVLYSSNYVRAMSTAKYIAYNNKTNLNVDERLGERKFGVDVKDLPQDYFMHQWVDLDYTELNGESINDTNKRISEVINEIINNNKDKTICIVSHATAISSFLLNYFELKINGEELHWYLNNEEVFDGNFKAPHLFKLVFDDNNNLIEFKNIGR